MIAVDTSALIAILLDEPEGPPCLAALEIADRIVISAGTLAETLIVAVRRGFAAQVVLLAESLSIEVQPVTANTAEQIGQAYLKWGRGAHPAALNFGDCFAYEVAKTNGCKLLYIGKDFKKTDIASVL